MQANGHHFCAAVFTFGIKRIETVFEVVEKLIACIKALRGCKAHIIGIKRIGNNQLVMAAAVHPIGQIIGVAVRDIVKPASGGDQ